MTLLVPRKRELKPAIVYYPGVGFASADYEKFIEMCTALAKAGFVVASAEYRTVSDRYPALINDAKAVVRYLRAHAEQFKTGLATAYQDVRLVVTEKTMTAA